MSDLQLEVAMLTLSLYIILVLLGPVLGFGVVLLAVAIGGVGTRGRVASYVSMVLALSAYFVVMLHALLGGYDPHDPHRFMHDGLPILVILAGVFGFGVAFNQALLRRQPHPALQGSPHRESPE